MLTLPACKVLAEMGYPQDEADHYWEGSKLYTRHVILDHKDADSFDWFVACPSEIEALDYLDKEFGYYWERWSGPGVDRPTWWGKHKDELRARGIVSKTPSDLILAIRAHWLKECDDPA